jgi:hypothetical protein
MYINTILSRPNPNPRTTRLLTLTLNPTLIRIHLYDHLIHLDPNHTIHPIIIIDTSANHLLDQPR